MSGERESVRIHKKYHPQNPSQESREAMALRETSQGEQVQVKLRRTEEEIIRVKEERNKYKQRYDELLSSLMSTKTEGTAKLYDGWRPDELAQKWDTFKNQTYFNAFFALIEENVDKGSIGTILLELCQAVYNHCVQEDELFQRDLKKSLENFRRRQDQEEQLKKSLWKALKDGQSSRLLTLNDEEVKKTMESVLEVYSRSDNFLKDLEEQALEEVHQQRKHAVTPETSLQPPKAVYKSVRQHEKYFKLCEDYIQECYGLCRMMQLQIPTMHLDFDVKERSKVNENEHEVHDAPASGVPEDAVVKKLLVPSLHRCQGGPLLVKGLVTIA